MVLGLVLAVLPLMISALEHYNEGLKPLKDFVRYRAMIRDLVCELGTQRALFRNTLERLLSGLVSSDVELALLLNIPGGLEWRDDKLDRKLRLRLRDTFGVYMESVGGMETNLENLQATIGLDKNGLPTWYDASTHRKAWKKFMVCLSKKKHEVLLEKLDSNNKNLMNLTKDSLDLEPLRIGRRQGREPFQKVRDCARNLHNVLKLGWSSNCRSPHSANLRLEMRDCDTAPSFRVLFAHANSPSVPQSGLFLWRETIIRPLNPVQIQTNKQHVETINEHIAAQLPSPTMTSSKSLMAIISSSFQLNTVSEPLSDQNHLPFPKSRQPSQNTGKKSAWAQATKGQPDESEHSKHSAGINPDMKLESKTHADTRSNASLSKIADLCHTLQTVDSELQHERCLGCLVDENSLLGVYTIRQQIAVSLSQPTTITLKDLLVPKISINTALSSIPEARTSGPNLTKKNRLRLAVTLASTALQLHTTPWLQKEWGNEDILFHNGSTEHPYVSKKFENVLDERQEPGNALPKLPWTPVRNESIFNLGVLLLELSYGKSLGAFRTPDDPPMFTDYAIATRLADKLAEEESSGYVDATRACIFCDFGSRAKTPSLDNAAFKQAVYEDVLVPLEEDWKHWNRSST